MCCPLKLVGGPSPSAPWAPADRIYLARRWHNVQANSWGTIRARYVAQGTAKSLAPACCAAKGLPGNEPGGLLLSQACRDDFGACFQWGKGSWIVDDIVN
jgi:hypothetical protein